MYVYRMRLTDVLVAAARQDLLVDAEDVAAGHVVAPTSAHQVPHCRCLRERLVLVAPRPVPGVEPNLLALQITCR